MDPRTIIFDIDRETKRTIRYEERVDSQPAAIGTLYVQKWLLGTKPPETIKVTIESGL
jgi:hypothetical protein